MEPGLEAARVAKRSQVAPGNDERRLHRVLGQVDVAKDPRRDRHALVADHAGKGVEGLLVALLRSVHELVLHPISLIRRARVGAITWESLAREQSVRSSSFSALPRRAA